MNLFSLFKFSIEDYTDRHNNEYECKYPKHKTPIIIP